MAFANVEPIGGVREDYRAAVDMALFANANRDPKKQREPYDAGDFLDAFDWWGERTESEESEEEAERRAQALVAGMRAWAAANQRMVQVTHDASKE